jgi:hypothetical protein
MASRLHLGTGTLALLALALPCLAPAAHAQTHKVDAPEKVTRAIGVYEWTGELTKPAAARLIPVSLFINSHFEDAGVYLARPVPFALQTGDVYSIERAGVPEGTLDLDFARSVVTRHSGSDDDLAGAWYGYGRFLTVQQEAKLAKLKPSAKLPVIVSSADEPDDAAPHFIYRQPQVPGPGGDTKSSTGSTPATPAPPADADRPVLQHRTPATPDSSPTPSTTPGPAPDDDPERPTLRHRDPAPAGKAKKEKPGGYVTGPADSLNDDPNRPRLRRGVPTGLATTAELSGLPPDLHQAVAVSDAADRDAHPFARDWESSHEHAETLAAMEQLAQPRAANYLLTNKLTLPTTDLSSRPEAERSAAAVERPAAPTPKTAHRKKPTPPAPAPTPVPLTHEQLRAYTLSYGGLPTFVYTTEVEVAIGGPVYLTMVVQRLPAGEYQVALSSVTDAAHLDRVPWLRPVDVVDPDWSHRGSLLFELRAQTTRQFALYRLISAKAEQTFLTGITE